MEQEVRGGIHFMLHNFLPKIMNIIESRKMGWVGHVTLIWMNSRSFIF
jgi:hypothetical protein